MFQYFDGFIGWNSFCVGNECKQIALIAIFCYDVDIVLGGYDIIQFD